MIGKVFVMVSRVRTCVMAGFVVASVAMSGGLVACSDSGSSETSSDTSQEAVSKNGKTGSSSSKKTENLSDYLKTSLRAEALSLDDGYSYKDEPSYVKISGTIKNTSSKAIQLSANEEFFLFDCKFPEEYSKVDSKDDEAMCGEDVADTVTIPAHGEYSASKEKGIIYGSRAVFDSNNYSRTTDGYRKRGGKKQFSIPFTRILDPDKEKNVYINSDYVWIDLADTK